MKKIILFLLMLIPLAAMSQGKLYKQYASRNDLTVAQVSGFKLNDSVRVDVVLVVADNDEAWNRLKRELDIVEKEGTSSWLGELNQPSKRVRWNGKPLLRVVASHSRRTVAFYCLNNEMQYDALLDYQINKIEKHK